jgi:hypothetical protein
MEETKGTGIWKCGKTRIEGSDRPSHDHKIVGDMKSGFSTFNATPDWCPLPPVEVNRHD